jgi:DNA-binding beta-propeller fold protein YncE
MKHYRAVAIVLLVALCINATLPIASVKAQSSPLFEGMIAYVDSTGNIVIATGDGKRVPITNDADLSHVQNNGTTYAYINFSPNGALLAFVRYGNGGEDSKLFIYDIASNNTIAKFELSDVGSIPMLWHRDSDSFIVSKSGTGNDDIRREYYRQYLSGERILLFDLLQSNNGLTINFDINTVFYTPDQASFPLGILYNWVENTKYEIELGDFNVAGYWSHDGLHYIYTGNESEVSIIDLKSGTIIKTIDIPPVKRVLPGGETYYSSALNAKDLSPDSKHLLLDNDVSLYDLNMETSSIESVYTSPNNGLDYRLDANWSRSGNVILVDEYSVDSSYYDDISDDQHLLDSTPLKRGGA